MREALQIYIEARLLNVVGAMFLSLLSSAVWAGEMNATSKAFLDGDCEHAMRRASSMLEEMPDDPIEMLAIAVCGFRKGDIASTVKYRDAVFLQPDKLYGVREWLADMKSRALGEQGWLIFAEALILEYEGSIRLAIEQYKIAKTLLPKEVFMDRLIEVLEAKSTQQMVDLRFSGKLEGIREEIGHIGSVERVDIRNATARGKAQSTLGNIIVSSSIGGLSYIYQDSTKRMALGIGIDFVDGALIMDANTYNNMTRIRSKEYYEGQDFDLDLLNFFGDYYIISLDPKKGHKYTIAYKMYPAPVLID